MNPLLWCHLVQGSCLSSNSLSSFRWLPFQLFPPCTLKTLFHCIKNFSTPSVSTQLAAFTSRPSVKPGSPLRTFPSFFSSQIKDGEAWCASKPLGSGISIILVPNCLFQLLPPPLKFAPFSFIAFNMFCHSCLPLFRSLPRFDSPLRFFFLPTPVIIPADFTFLKETLQTLQLLVSWPLISLAFTSAPLRTGFPWPHPWPYHRLKLSCQWNLKP